MVSILEVLFISLVESSQRDQRDVQEHLPKRLPVGVVQHRKQTAAVMGQEGAQRPHQTHHRQ